MRRAIVALCLIATSLGAVADDHDAVFWLNRMVSAAKQLNYSGTFTYLSGQRFETMRVAHAVGESGEIERLETLDGSPRERGLRPRFRRYREDSGQPGLGTRGFRCDG